MTLLLETAGLAVLFSIVPLILDELDLTESVLWRTCGWLFAVAHALHMGVITFRGSPIESPASRVRGKGATVAISVLLAQIISSAASSLVVLKFVYLLALAWHVVGAALSFGILLVGQVEEEAG